MHQWHILPDPAATATACAIFLAECIANLLDRQALCHLALPGGKTPAACLSELAAQPLPWERVHWYLGDERCLPPNDPERNDGMIRQALAPALATSPDNLHTIPAELGPEAGAEAYTAAINTAGRLDIALLGMGEDGHTASLFPANPALSDDRSVVPVHQAPKPPPDRISLGIQTLRSTGLRVVLATGKGKLDAIRQIKSGVDLPINRIGVLEWFVDQAAVGQ